MAQAWRIAAETPDHAADQLTGAELADAGGRWSAAGLAIVYAADSRSLACLESLAQLEPGAMACNRYLVRIDIPDALWSAATRHTPDSLPVGWDAEPAGKVSIDLGTAWAQQAKTAILRVPSVIVPEEENILINPAHPDAAQIRAVKLRRWLYDQRLC